MSGKGRRITPDVVKDELPRLQPTTMGASGLELTREGSETLRAEVTAQMSNAVAQELVADEAKETPEEGTLGELAASAGRVAAAPPPETPPDASEPADPNEAEQGTEDAAAQLAQAQGGESLPDDIRQPAEEQLGVSLAHVRLFRDEPAVADMDAGGAAFGEKVFMAPGRFDPDSPDGRGVLYEELAHAANAPTPTGEDLTLGGTDSAVESAAGRVHEAAEGGGPIAPADVSGASAPANTIQRGEAGVHQGELTMPGMGVSAPHLGSFDNPNVAGDDSHALGGLRHRDSANLSPDQRAALQVYSGNFMSDLSQANVPMLINILQNVPSSRGDSGTIGAEGAGVIAQALVRAFAILDIGTEAAALVTAQTTEVYEAERHIDNPMGTSNETYAVENDEGVMAGVAETPQAMCVETTEPMVDDVSANSGGLNPLTNMAAGPRRDAAGGAEQFMPTNTNQQRTIDQHAGSAVPGLQFDNPRLFQISDAGLANHIYNSTEASKQSYVRALQAGPTPAGRMHTGYADHIVQDYYSHSNFIEVALNSYIGDALAAGRGRGGVHREAHDHGVHGRPAEAGLAHAEPHVHHAAGVVDEHLGTHAQQQVEGAHGALAHGAGVVDDHIGTHERVAPRNQEEFFAAMAHTPQGEAFRAEQERREHGEPGAMVTPLFVSTLYDEVDPATGEHRPARAENGRLAITTGTFGGTDTQISLAHLLLPQVPKLHEALMAGVQRFLGLIDTAPPGQSWSGIKEILLSSGRDGAVLGTLLDALGSVVTVELPSGIDMHWTDLQVSPGWFGEPWTVEVPDASDPLDIVYSDVPITSGLALFINLGRKVERLKSSVARFARWIGVAQVVEAIDAAWDGLKDLVTRRIQDKLHQWTMEVITEVIAQLRGEPMSLEEASRIASGSLASALNLANEAMHHAEGQTSMEHRLLNEGGDLYANSHAGSMLEAQGRGGDAARRSADSDRNGQVSEAERSAWIARQRAELEANVGPLRGTGTAQDPWMPIAPLPPSHSEIGKDHPPHDAEHHGHEPLPPDYNPAVLNPDSDAVEIFRTQEDDDARRHEHDRETEATQRRINEGHEHGAGGHDHEAGSTFYGLGVALAREAQRHMYRQLERAWSELYGGERHMADLTDDQGNLATPDAGALGAAASQRRDAAMEVGHDQMMQQANAHADREHERNAGRGFQRAQESSDVHDLAAQGPSVMGLLNLVDLYLAHPEDSTWWRTVMDNYVSQHADEVYQHIQRRNSTRGYRSGAADPGHDDHTGHDH